MDRVEAGSFGQCCLYSKLYSAAFLSDRPTPKDYYAYEGARCTTGYAPTIPKPPPPPTNHVYVPTPPPPTPPPTNPVYEPPPPPPPTPTPPPTWQTYYHDPTTSDHSCILNSTCTAVGLVDVATITECEAASMAVGFGESTATNWDNTHYTGHYNFGCFLGMNGRLYWNPTGSANPSSLRDSICRAPGTHLVD